MNVGEWEGYGEGSDSPALTTVEVVRMYHLKLVHQVLSLYGQTVVWE